MRIDARVMKPDHEDRPGRGERAAKPLLLD
jgi:hypothetical protein